MSKPYDATGKHLLEADPAGWAEFFGIARPRDKVALLDTDLSAVTAAADKVLLVRDDPPWVLDIEFQSWRDPSLPWQLLKYNALLHEKHAVSVASVLVVLAERAWSPAYTGRLAVVPPFGPAWEFAYTVVKVWELDAERLLAGPLAVLPLAPVADLPLSEVPAALQRVIARVSAEADPTTASELLTAMGFLLQLRYGKMTSDVILEDVKDIRDLALFQKFIREGEATGRTNGLREAISRQGRKKFGTPTAAHEAALTAITDLTRLEALSEKLLDVATWDDLLAGE